MVDETDGLLRGPGHGKAVALVAKCAERGARLVSKLVLLPTSNDTQRGDLAGQHPVSIEIPTVASQVKHCRCICSSIVPSVIAMRIVEDVLSPV